MPGGDGGVSGRLMTELTAGTGAKQLEQATLLRLGPGRILKILS